MASPRTDKARRRWRSGHHDDDRRPGPKAERPGGSPSGADAAVASPSGAGPSGPDAAGAGPSGAGPAGADPSGAFDADQRRRLLRRSLVVLAAGVIPAGAALSGTVATTALLAEKITGNGTLAGFAAASITGGTALATIPIAQLMASRGRRTGIVAAYIIGAIGGICAFFAADLNMYWLLLIGAALIGAANSGTMAARFAASDLADEDARARAIGTLVWLGMFGSVIGPNLALDWSTGRAEALGLPRLSGPYLTVLALFSIAATVVWLFLRPDPLEVSGGMVNTQTSSAWSQLGTSFRVLLSYRAAALAVMSLAVAHAVMVGVMAMTSLHMDAGGHSLRIIGLVISLHIVGMYFFAPIIGWFVDRVGAIAVLGTGGLILIVGAELAARNHGMERTTIFSGLFLIGVGWSCAMVASSTLVTDSVPTDQRVKIQGLSDFAMSAAGVIAAIGSGTVVEYFGYGTLARSAAVLSLVIIWAAASLWRHRSTDGEPRQAAVGSA